MKRILLLIAALLIAFIAANAHCYTWYTTLPTVSVSGSITTTYTGNKNFVSTGSSSGTATFNSGSSFNSWTALNFENKTHIKVPITFPVGKGKLGFYGTNDVTHINMNGEDTIWSEDVSIDTLISSGSVTGKYNVIATADSVYIHGNYYKPGTAYYSTPGDLSTRVLIGNCSGFVPGTALPVILTNFYYGNNNLVWEVGIENNISNYIMLYSDNGADWNIFGEKIPYNISGSKYSMPTNKNGFYKLKVIELDGTVSYSSTIRVNTNINSNDDVKIYPNPTNNILIIEASMGLENIEIYNFSGIRLINTTSTNISIKDLPCGNYMIKITRINGDVSTNKIIKN